jgi:DNA helicase II / ATP-dependent DNA helicase PcrA
MRDSFNDFLEKNLNPSQQKAVHHESGAILVVAGAGSGKTRVITARITNLIINKNVSPSSIVALTFTNKAANEMKERIASFLGYSNELPFVGTFHAYCVQLLKKYQEHLPHPFFSILDMDDKQKMIQGILQRSGLQKQFSAKNIVYTFSQMKNNLDEKSSINMEYVSHPLLTDIFNAYEAEKRASKCLDFDDLLLETLRLFKNNSVVKNRFQEKIRHILIDEYQDTNVVQHELLKAMTLCEKALALTSVCAVGDEDQSIYSWRGATVANMGHFKTVFPATTVITIEQNYRSAQPILHLANTVIQNNSSRTPKNLWSEKKGTNRVSKLLCLTEYQEARTIAQLLLVAKNKYGLNNVGILYRTHTQSRAIEEALIKESIPYRIIGGIQFYERKEIKDLLAYLKIIVNPFDRTSFFRIINIPARGLGDKFEEAFYKEWSQEPFATWQDIIKQFIQSGTLGKAKTSALEEFTTITHSTSPAMLTSKALAHIITAIDYFMYIKNSEEPQEARARLDNIKELLQAIQHFEAQGISTVADFLDEVALMQDKMNKQNRDSHAVSLMTLHAAKGLEFDLVILPGVEEGIIPTTRSLNSYETVEEERRLFYVGVTRAREHVLITHTKHRYSYGQMVDQSPSPFLREIPAQLLPHEDCCYWSVAQTHQFFAHWLGTNSATRKTSDVYVPSFTHSYADRPQADLKKPETSIKKETDGATSLGEDALPKTQNNVVTWKKNQPVKHAKYGIGTVEQTEEKASGDIHVTVRFRVGVKKIISQFLQRV